MSKIISRYLFLTLTTLTRSHLARLVFVFLILTFFIAGVGKANAHDIGYQAINTTLKASENEILLSTSVPFSFTYDSADREVRLATLSAYFNNTFLIEQNSQPCQAVINSLAIDEKAPKTVFGGRYMCHQSINNIEGLKITSFIFEEFFNPYDHFINLSINEKTYEIVLNQDNQVYPTPENESNKESKVAGSENLFTVVKRFIGLGIEHILLGFDHILFLLATILIVRSFRSIVLLVSSFTLAHSVTLILAGLGVITLTSAIVEPIIALSIAVMALRNIWIIRHKGEHFNLKERWSIVFGFGLIHGLGFAGLLSDVSIPKQYFIPALLSFNIGVEVGQFIILAAVLPYLFLMRKWRFRKHFLYSTSAAITAIALFWMGERILTLWIK